MTATGESGQVLGLDDPRTRCAELAGAKAAHLARAGAAGLPALPGFVVLPPGAAAPGPRRPDGAARTGRTADGDAALRAAWHELSAGGRRPLVVRSSSPEEDTQGSSMAGQFTSVLDVRGWSAFAAALRTVRGSAGPAAAPIPVLVQPMVRSRAGGVLFGADPVAGRTDRLLVSVVRGGPDTLVNGVQPGSNLHVSPRGRLLAAEPSEPAGSAGPSGSAGSGRPSDSAEPAGPSDSAGGAASPAPARTPAPPGPGRAGLLDDRELRRLAALARRARRVFGGPQDIEFGFQEGTGRLWLFQSRPITAMAPRPARRARLLGPGPVAETLPGVLQPLEEDLWLAPMAHGLAVALDLAGTAGRRRLRGTPVVRSVEGRAAADLALLGLAGPAAPAGRGRALARRVAAGLNPLPAARRLAAAWRIGRLRAGLPRLAVALLADLDRELGRSPAPAELTLDELAAALRWSRSALVALHAQEVLAGALLPADRNAADRTAAALALRAHAAGRAAGLTGDRLLSAYPEVLALTAPSLTAPPAPPALPAAATPAGTASRPSVPAAPEGRAPGRPPAGPAGAGRPAPVPAGTLPAQTGAPDGADIAARLARLPAREGLRMRIRWVQEFQVRLVHQVALRCGNLEHRRIALLRWPELLTAARDCALPAELPVRRPRHATAPLPDAFRLAPDGTVVAEPAAPGDGTGRGVSGGRVHGTAWDGTGEPPADPVLVVRTLDPGLAPLLPSLAGLLAQTGSPLSHLAVLAREYRVPAVTGAADAVRRFPPGTPLLLDGTTGDVSAAVPDRSSQQVPR